jgi:hypothetical protein
VSPRCKVALPSFISVRFGQKHTSKRVQPMSALPKKGHSSNYVERSASYQHQTLASAKIERFGGPFVFI